MGIINKAFYDYAYAVGCRRINKNQELVPSKDQPEFVVLMPTQREWYADSFCFTYKERVFVFCEIMGRNKGKGTLGVAEFKDGGFSKVTEVLREPFHLSYPNVFEYKNKLYMIPETNEVEQIRLYESVEFPYKWKLKKVLAEGLKVVDSSFLPIEKNKFLIYSQDIEIEPFGKRSFMLNLDIMELTEIENPKDASIERPGGNPVFVNGSYYRPLQDCERIYGEKLKLYKIDKLSTDSDKYREVYFDDITVEKVPTDQKVNFERIHTITRSGDYEAIDLLYNKFYITKPIKRIFGRLFR